MASAHAQSSAPRAGTRQAEPAIPPSHPPEEPCHQGVPARRGPHSGVERATVVGHSMGGMVARRVAIEHPDRVERLVLFGYPRLCRLIASAQWPIR